MKLFLGLFSRLDFVTSSEYFFNVFLVEETHYLFAFNLFYFLFDFYYLVNKSRATLQISVTKNSKTN